MNHLVVIALLALQAGNAADLMAAAKARLTTDRAGARDLYQEAATVCETAGDYGCAGRAYNDLGLMAYFDGTGGEVRRWYERAAGAFERAGMIKEQAMAIRGTTFDSTMSQADWVAAIDRALGVAASLDDPGVSGLLHHSRGDAMFAAGRYIESQQELEIALGLLERAGNPAPIARVLTSLGRAFRLHGHPERALEQYQRAFALQEKAKDLPGQSQTMNAVAIAHVALGNVAEAVKAAEQSLALARQSNQARTISFRSAGLAKIYLDAGRFADAETLLLKVVEQDGEAGVGEFHLNLAAVQTALGRPLEAIVTGTQGIEISTQKGLPEYVMEGLKDRATAYERADRLPEALTDARRAAEILESLRATLVPEDALKQGFADTNKKVYSTLIRLLLKNGNAAEALLASERGRARAFLDLLATRSISSETANAPTLLSRFRDPTEPLLRSFVAADPPQLSGVTATAARLRSHIVTYWVDPEAVTVSVISPAGAVHGTRINLTSKRLDALVRATWQAQSEAKAPKLRPTRGAAAGRVRMDENSRAALRELYDLLVLPIRQWLPARGDARLTIVPHGPLFRLSFAALTNERNQYLIEGYSVHYAPSIAVLQLTETHRRAAADAPNVLIADPDLRTSPGDEVLGRLPAARREVLGVANAIHTNRSQLLIGAPATETRVRQAASSARVLHFATHGIVPDDQPFDAYLALGADGVDPAQDGRLTAREVYDLKLTADLVVLSGCRTARGQVTGDGVLGLSRAFLYAGTPSMMATLWDVYDDAAERLLPSFYAAWENGGDKAAALRQAQIGLIRRLRAGAIKVATPAGEFVVPEHPAFWAGFVLVGEP